MKHDTHILLANAAIEGLAEGAGRARTPCGRAVGRARRRKLAERAKELQRLLLYHREAALEAAWAPDDVLADKAAYHTFKLFTAEGFRRIPPAAQTVPGEAAGGRFFRLPGGGGLPYKVDHLARVIADMRKLRAYNDQFSQRQIIYMCLLASHYVADACVPLHCDLRDDPPSAADREKPRGRYLSPGLHGQVEELWERAAATRPRVPAIGITDLESASLMGFMIDLCVGSCRQSLELFPPRDESAWSAKAITPAVTAAVFARAVAAVGTVWMAVG